MRIKLVRIGNSRGVRLPKSFIEEAGLQNEIELQIVDSGIVIRPVSTTRAGWDEAAQSLRERGEDGLLDEISLTDFDDSEWVWE